MNTGLRLRTALAGLLAAVSIAMLTVLASCASPQDIPGAMRIKGTIRHVNIEGGCWVVEVGDNVRTKQFYELIGKDLPEVSINDAVITVWIVLKPDVATTCQVGQVAEIVDVVDVEKPGK